MSVMRQAMASELADEVTSIADLLPRAAKQYPACGIYVAAGDRKQQATFCAYPDLLKRSLGILGGLQTCAGGPGATIVLLIERPADFIAAFWACVMGRYIPCPVAPIRNDPDRWAKHLAHIDSLLGRPLFVSTGELLQDLPPSIDSADLEDLRANASLDDLPRPGPRDLAIFMLTSGSTGNSKAVELTHGNLLASLAARAERQALTAADIMFNWIAFDHVAALLESHMIALYVCASQLHAEPAAVLADPLRFLDLIHRHRVSVAFAPNFFLGQINAAIVAERSALALDLSCLRRIVTGGEANVVTTGLRFLELLAPFGLARTALWPAFGMTETCAASVYSHEFPDADAQSEFAAVGLPLRGLEMRVVDERGHAVPAGGAGELQLQGPMIFHRYHKNEEATRDAFMGDGWFRTGDVGRIEEGRLRLIARNKDSIIVSGVNYFSHELETRLEQLAGIERSFVAVFPTRPKGADTEQLVVTFATTLESSDEKGLHQLVVAARNTTIMLWGFRPSLILPLPKSTFPKTSLGKIQRSLMRKRLEASELADEVRRIAEITMRQTGAYVAPESSQEAAIVGIFAKILGADPGTLSTSATFFDLGGTSLDILKLAQALHRQLGLKATLPLVLQNPTVQGLARRVVAGEQDIVSKYDPIIPLQLTGDKTPLFCVHPGNGEVFVLVNVAKYFLNDRPFFALRAPGFNEGEVHFATVAQMVNTYVEAILARQPRGPFAIAGYSLGCAVAFEITKELRLRGHEVPFLGCIDFWPCHVGKMFTFNMATGLALVTDLITRAQFEQLNQHLRPDIPSNEICEQILRCASPERLAELDLDLHKFATWARVAHSMESLLMTHLTSGSTQTMTVFCSEGISSHYGGQWTRASWRNELARWDAFVSQPRYVDVPGHHHGLMGPKHVAVFQALLRSEIDRAFAARAD
jgi:acyl-CoA synthetase (AMP-forming)/AMP-acid ligase II/thioesterase domain-containing protein/acyl carrier protein